MVLIALVATASAIVGSFVAYAVRKHSKCVYEDADLLKAADVPDDSLFPLFQPHLVPMKEIHDSRGYSSVLSLVQALIGVQPTCDMVLEIWPPAFQCYNLTVPNLLNLPHMLLGKVTGAASKELVSIAMYVSSRASGCAYCSSHCCSFAARRGVDPQVLGQLLGQVTPPKGDDHATNQRRAVAKVAYGLGTVPATLTKDDVDEIYNCLSDSDVEWIAAAAAMFGSFNKLMDGLGIPLEQGTYAETVPIMDDQYDLAKAGAMLKPGDAKAGHKIPVDTWSLIVSCLYHGVRPGGALALDAKLHGDTPKTVKECMSYLKVLTGQSFDLVLGDMKHERVARAVTAIVAKNFKESLSAGLGVGRKALVGAKFAKIIENDRLERIFEEAASKFGAPKEDDDELTALVLKVAKAVSYTPNHVTSTLVEEVRNSQLTAPMLVELVTFVAIVQMLHRLEVFYRVKRQ